MTSFLFIVSFLLHIIAIYIIIQLYWQIQSLKNTDSSEINDLLKSYVQEIKDENKRLQNTLNEKASNKEVSLPDSAGTKLDVTIEEEVPVPFKEDVVQDYVEASLESKVLGLYHQGLSVTEIAKKLDCGKTEAELIINLNRNM
ncbi:DUF6115 domain-containing protein [Oceanobacillus bengalensis]|nr:hypothetical protein [Oceanobacillus bengalensis]